MKVVLMGATGMLGQALLEVFTHLNFEVITVARSNSNYNIDLLSSEEKVREIIALERPDVVVNSAAIVNLQYCEESPEAAYLLNAKLPCVIAEACRNIDCFFIQISTDHYYINDHRKKHTEIDNVVLVNEYARTKYAGEVFALTYENSLVIRTNIVGFRNKKNQLTFVEWIIHSLNNGENIIGFEDFYTSSIDVYHFSDILTELMEQKVTGIINIGSADVLSKYEFIYRLALLLGKENCVSRGTVNKFQSIRRAESLGLNTKKLNSILKKQKVPSSQEVICKIIEKYKEGAFHELQK